MYLKSIEFENIGPIECLNYHLPFSENDTPKPVIFVGENGTGKSIVLAHIVNALLDAKSIVFEDSEVEKGKVYKFRSPQYIKFGKHHALASVVFTDGFTQSELTMEEIKKNFESRYGYTPNWEYWGEVPESASSSYSHNFSRDKNKLELLEEIFHSQTILFFPSNRFEEPAWLNVANLLNKSTYLKLQETKGFSDRVVINYSPLRENQDWLLDVLYDRNAIERKLIPILNIQGDSDHGLARPVGVATNILREIEKFISILFRTERNFTWGIGSRGRRQISVFNDHETIIRNLFSLSTGQTILLDIFLSIIRDFDLCYAKFETLDDIIGIVVIDEVDLHLHVEFQYSVLPELIKLFPKIQFIMTSHSPLFTLGLKNSLGEGEFHVIELPIGNQVDVENFSEFETAYEYFKKSTKFESDLSNQIKQLQMPILFTEGDTDVRYLKRAAELLGQSELIEKFKILDSTGFGGLNKIWRHFNTKLSDAFPHKIVLLYDCDVNRSDEQKGSLYRRNIPKHEYRIGKGIENLFPNDSIEKARQHKAEFIDIVDSYSKFIRGVQMKVPETWNVNLNEKSNLCDWFRKNGTKDDFSNFKKVFEILENIISDN